MFVMNEEMINWYNSNEFYADPENYKTKFLNFSPTNVNLDNNLGSTFGCSELEIASVQLIKFLQENGNMWNLLITIDSIKSIDHNTFALMCASGWISPAWFPTKYHFRVSEAWIDRLYKSSIIVNNVNDQEF